MSSKSYIAPRGRKRQPLGVRLLCVREMQALKKIVWERGDVAVKSSARCRVFFAATELTFLIARSGQDRAPVDWSAYRAQEAIQTLWPTQRQLTRQRWLR